MKPCIFLIGKEGAGKTTMLRNLTGQKTEGLCDVIAPSGRKVKALVMMLSISERTPKPTPNEFPDLFEKECNLTRNEYEILICASRTSIRGKYSLDDYMNEAIKKGFEVKVAIIETTHDGQKPNLKKINQTCHNLHLTPILLDVSNGYDTESQKIKEAFYPR